VSAIHHADASSLTEDRAHDLSQPVRQDVLEHKASKHGDDVEEMDVDIDITTPNPALGEVLASEPVGEVAGRVLERSVSSRVILPS
jgi:hypothetical protein